MSSLADELVLLRLHEARSNASTEFKNQDGQAAASGLAARRRAVREAQFVIGSYGARAGEDGRVASAKGSTAWDHAEPIRLSCGEEALKVRYEARQRDLRQRERIEGIRARMEGKGACVGGVSWADGAGQSAVLREVQGMRQGSLVLRLVPDVKRSIDYGDERAGAGVGTGAGGADVQRQQWAPPPKRGGFERPGTVQPAPATRSNHPVANANRNASDRNVRNGHPSGNSNAGGGFGSARSEYIQTMKKQGKKPTFEGQAGRQAGFGHSNTDANNATANGKAVSMDIESQTRHLPPYMRKALASMNSLGNNNGNTNNTNNNKNTNNTNNANNTNNTAGQKKKTGASDDKAEGPMSQRTYELLGLDPDDELPDELNRIDPRMIEQVCNEVIDSSASVAWEDIAGQEAAKRLIQEVVVWPMMNPDIFKGARAPPKGILLFGPPGTGKTLLGKAIASNIEASFFAISASSLTSKWIGDGEKMVKALFAVAGWLAPSVIFIDEIDSLLSARKSEGEHESSRRLKTEILVQMEGCDPSSSERKVLLVGATNRPEELDEAARRRMPKQMYIPLPCEKAREEMIHRVLTHGSIASQLSAEDVAKVVAKTEGYSGSDMKNLIQEACQGPIREAVRRAGAAVATLKEQDLRPVVLKDFAVASKAQRASTEPSEILRYEEYNGKHGAKIVEGGEEDGGEGDDVSEGW